MNILLCSLHFRTVCLFLVDIDYGRWVIIPNKSSIRASSRGFSVKHLCSENNLLNWSKICKIPDFLKFLVFFKFILYCTLFKSLQIWTDRLRLLTSLFKCEGKGILVSSFLASFLGQYLASKKVRFLNLILLFNSAGWDRSLNFLWKILVSY